MNFLRRLYEAVFSVKKKDTIENLNEKLRLVEKAEKAKRERIDALLQDVLAKGRG